MPAGLSSKMPGPLLHAESAPRFATNIMRTMSTPPCVSRRYFTRPSSAVIPRTRTPRRSTIDDSRWATTIQRAAGAVAPGMSARSPAGARFGALYNVGRRHRPITSQPPRLQANSHTGRYGYAAAATFGQCLPPEEGRPLSVRRPKRRLAHTHEYGRRLA